MKTKLASKITALVAACTLVLSGASAFAATASSDRSSTASKTSAAAQKKKCKKNKKSKKCKKTTGFVPGRVVELTYMGPAIGSADTVAINPLGLVAPVNFVPGPGETQALIEIVDDISSNAEVNFSHDSDGDGFNDTGFEVCGKTPQPVEMIPGMQYNVFPYLLPSTTCTDGVATSGSITVTFNKI